MYEQTLLDFDIAKIADSGQCFRLNPADNTGENWRLIADGDCLQITCAGEGRHRFDCSKEAFQTRWRPYYDLGTDYGRFRDAIPSGDAYLKRAAEAGRGIRILRQDPFEMLITFILSQRKNIPAIKQGVENLCRCYGEERESAHGPYNTFPTAESLAGTDEDALRGCALGYRAPYVHKAARMVAQGELDLQNMATLPDETLLETLLTVPGVGVKVANCVMLFGYHRIAAFPIDVWIARVVEREYGGTFPLERYEGFAGVIQQYMFYHARRK